MRRFVLLILILLLLPIRVLASDYTVPEPDGMGERYMPEEVETFGDGVWQILTDVVSVLQPAITEAARLCAVIVSMVVILSIVNGIAQGQQKVTDLVGVVVISGILLGTSQTMIGLASQTVKELSSYGQLLLPVMTATLAAQGGTTTSGALYMGTAVFDSVLSSTISRVMIPVVYIYLVLSIASCAMTDGSIDRLCKQAKSLVTWALKTSLYIFMGYMSITKVISGSVDAAAMKATKLTIAGMVPVVGGILSDASEAVLVSAQLVKNSAGLYGMLAVLSIWIEPFLRIGIQYLLLKITLVVCELFGTKSAVAVIKHFSAAMGLLLAMTGTVCLMLMVSIVCFMKGVA